MRVALVLAGKIRGLAHAVKTWGFLGSVDSVFAYCPPPSDGEAPVESVFPDAIVKYAEDDPGIHPVVNERSMGGRTSYKYPPGVVAAMAWYNRREALRMVGDGFDLIVLTRPDLSFRKPLVLDGLDPKRIWTPLCNLWGGLCDRMAVAGMDAMRYYCDMYNHLNDDVDAMTVGNLERRLAAWISRGPHPIGFLQANFLTLDANGEVSKFCPPLEGPVRTTGMHFYETYGDWGREIGRKMKSTGEPIPI